jgi:VCBS repeat-containing protein
VPVVGLPRHAGDEDRGGLLRGVRHLQHRLHILSTSGSLRYRADYSSSSSSGHCRIDRSAPYAFTVDCSQLGDYAFDLLVEGEQQVTITTVTGADGTLSQTVIRSSFSETDTNSVSQASLPLSGSLVDVTDHLAGTRTVRGSIARGTQPGAGTYFQEAGQIVFDGGVGNVLFAAGRHDAVAFGGINASLCAALADA